MCLNHQLFLAIDTVEGDNEYDAQGFIGLGPEGAMEGLSLPISLY